MTTLKCFFCGHTWYQRRESLPRICPKCKRANWQDGKRKRAIGTCADCGATDVRIDRHRIVPAVKGGTYDAGNVPLLCRRCHAKHTESTRTATYTRPLTLRLTPADHKALARRARVEGTTIMAVVRRAIRRELSVAT
jgi:hypothetical protein